MILTLYCGLIFYLSHQPILPMPMSFEHQDKLVHMTAYAVMGCCAWLYFRHLTLSKMVLFIFALVFSSAYGASDEFHQSFIVGRDADVWDWVADSLGACLALFILMKKDVSVRQVSV
ncbi:MAG: VanZ family protein [Ghiorsea sp.]